MGQLSTTFQFVGTCILFVFHTEQFLGVLGVDRSSFEVFHKDPSRRNVFLQTLEVDKIESRWIFRLHWTTQYLICCSRTQDRVLGFMIPLAASGLKIQVNRFVVHFPRITISTTLTLSSLITGPQFCSSFQGYPTPMAIFGQFNHLAIRPYATNKGKCGYP